MNGRSPFSCLKSMKKHILFTARDIGAAHQIKHVAKAFQDHGFRITAIASGVAHEALLQEGLKPVLFSVQGGKPFFDTETSEGFIEELIKSSYKIIKEINPDAVICGLTTLGYGIDEGVLYCASKNRLNIPSFQFLDTWGTFNHLRDGYPDIYFAIDRASVRLGIMGAKAPIEVVGSPKHVAYSDISIDLLRKKTREKLNLGLNGKLVGYFGQDPEAPGQEYNFMKLIETINSSNLDGVKCKLLVRMHPAYRDRYERFWRLLDGMKIDTADVSDGFSVEEILCACDLVTTCFSTTAVDHAFLSRFSSEPIGVVMYLLCGDDIKDYMVKNFGYWKIPILEDGIGYFAEYHDQIPNLIEHILNDAYATLNYFKSTKSLIIDNPSKRIIDIVSSFIR